MGMIVLGCNECTPHGAFNPSDISGLALWLRGDSATHTGTVLNSLIDKSSQGAIYTNTASSDLWTYVASDSNFNNQPTINNPNSIGLLSPNFNNGGQTQPFTIYAAVSPSSLSGDQIIITNSSDNTEFGVANETFYLGNPESNYGSNTLVLNTPTLLCGVYNGSASTAYQNNMNVPLLISSGTGTLSGNLTTEILIGYVGQVDSFPGTIAEILVYEGAHTAAQRDAIAAYMAQRYNKPSWVNPTFTPAALSPLAWFDSTYGITLNGSNVYTWADKSGNGNLIGQASAPLQPAYSAIGGPNNTPYVTFSNAAGNFLANTNFHLATTNPVEIFVVGTTSGTNGFNFLVDLGFTNNCIYQDLAGFGSEIIMYNTSNIFGPSLVNNKPFIVDGTNDGSGNGTLALNGGTASTGSIGTAAQGNPYLTMGSADAGSTNSWNGTVSELLVFNRLLPGQRIDLLNYLNAKYALQAPLSLNPLAWYSSDVGVTETSGLVTQWNDRSGNGYNLSQGTAIDRPAFNTSGGANNKPRLTFNTTNFLSNTAFTYSTASPVEVFVVATTTSTGSTVIECLVDLGDQNNLIYQYQNGTDLALYNGAALKTQSIGVGTPFIGDFTNDGSGNGTIAVNGGTPATGSVGTASQATTNLTIGSYNNQSADLEGWIGDIYEVLVFSYVLSTYQRQQVLQYLNAVYGIAT
jgi:hypothetical protein